MCFRQIRFHCFHIFMSGKQHSHLQEITNCEIWKLQDQTYINPASFCFFFFFLVPPLRSSINIDFLLFLYYCLLRLIAFSILQCKWVLFEGFWLHIHLAITARQSLPVHLYHSTTDLFMTLCSRNGQRCADLIICLSLRYLKLTLTSLFVFQRDVVHVHVSAVEPMPSRLHHRFIVRNIDYWRNLLYF